MSSASVIGASFLTEDHIFPINGKLHPVKDQRVHILVEMEIRVILHIYDSLRNVLCQSNTVFDLLDLEKGFQFLYQFLP